MTFRVGQRVACISEHWDRVGRASIPWRCPVFNAVYVVRELVPWLNRAGESCLLAEIRNGQFYGREPAFATTFFRPLIERETDISIFTALLNTKQRESVLCGND